MTYDQININAYEEARRAFKALIEAGMSFDAANVERAKVFEESKRCRCAHCLIEKHVTEFYSKGSSPQGWCNVCLKEYSKQRHKTVDREKWHAIKNQAMA